MRFAPHLGKGVVPQENPQNWGGIRGIKCPQPVPGQILAKLWTLPACPSTAAGECGERALGCDLTCVPTGVGCIWHPESPADGGLFVVFVCKVGRDRGVSIIDLRRKKGLLDWLDNGP